MVEKSGALGFCQYAGHSGAVEITWNGDTVAEVDCSFGNYKVCGFADVCELYQRHPVGSTRVFSNDCQNKNPE